MLMRTAIGAAFLAAAPLAHAQTSVVFQQGVTPLSGGGVYSGTIDTEFRAAAPTTEQGANQTISVDDFDGGFQTQGAIRFENLLISEGGLIPAGLSRDNILFAELAVWVTSPTSTDTNLTFNRVLGPDTSTGATWTNDDTWASLGGDLIPDQGGLLDGNPILNNDVEARSVPDFQVPKPSEDPVYNTTNDGADLVALFRQTVAADPLNPTPAEIDEIIDLSFHRFDVTDAIRDWLTDGETNAGWAIDSDSGDGWDFFASDVIGNAEGLITNQGITVEASRLRPALTIIFATGPQGDLNSDGLVDLEDFQLLLDNLAIELDGPIAAGATGDLNFDRRVDLNDFAVFKQAYDAFNGAGAFAFAVSVPEPGSVVMVISLLGVLGGVARRR